MDITRARFINAMSRRLTFFFPLILFLIYSAHRPYKKSPPRMATLSLSPPPFLRDDYVDLLITLFSLAHVGVCEKKKKKIERLTFDPARLRCRWRDQFFVRAPCPIPGHSFSRSVRPSPLVSTTKSSSSSIRVSFHPPCLERQKDSPRPSSGHA